MEKDISKTSKPEIKTENNVLSPEVVNAINAAVGHAVATAIPAVIEQLKPALNKPQNTSSTNPVSPPEPAHQFDQNGNYVTKLKGIPVQPGQDLRHVHPTVIKKWFSDQESKWKDNYNKRKVDGQSVNMDWTRG